MNSFQLHGKWLVYMYYTEYNNANNAKVGIFKLYHKDKYTEESLRLYYCILHDIWNGVWPNALIILPNFDQLDKFIFLIDRMIGFMNPAHAIPWL